MFVHAIPQVTPQRKGIHVIWAGPRAWLYSPRGLVDPAPRVRAAAAAA